MGVVVVWAGQPSHARGSWLAHAPHLPNIPYLPCRLVLVPCLLLEAPSCSSLGGLSCPEARRTTSGASGCRGGLQCELRSQPLSPCLVPSCRSPVHVFAYSCALPPTAVRAPIDSKVWPIASEERTRQVQKRSSIKEKSHQVSHLALLLSESIVVLHRSQKFSLTTFELQPPPGYNATFDETLLGRHRGREKGSSPSTV